MISLSKEIGPNEDAWLDVGCDPSNFTTDPPDLIDVAALIRYRDVFNDSHTLTWGWRMKNLKIIGELNAFSVDMLLASHFPGEVNIPEAEEIQEYNPEASTAHK